MDLDEAVQRSRGMQAVMQVAKPGDVINVDSYDKWYKPITWFGHSAIRKHHNELFGPDSCYRDTHTMMYFGPGEIFSVEPPKVIWADLFDYALDRMTVWRFTGFELGQAEVDLLKEGAEPMIGDWYDVGQLVDIALNHIFDHSQQIHYRIFDWGRKLKVCSVGVRVAYEYLRKNLPPGKQMERLFSTFRYDAWAEANKVQKLNNFDNGVDVEATAPGHFANSDYFANEFEFVAAFDQGEQILSADDLPEGETRPCPELYELPGYK